MNSTSTTDSTMLTLLYSGAILGWLSMLWSAIPWIALLMMAPQLTGLRLYTINNKEDCIRVQKRLVRSSHVADGGKRLGYSIGRGYFVHIAVELSDYGDKYTCWMVATEAAFRALTGEIDVVPVTPVVPVASSVASQPIVPTEAVATTTNNKLVVFDRQGSFYSTYFKRKELRIRSLLSVSPRPEQVAIMDAIVAHHRDHERAVAFISGRPGTGKSMLGLFLAARLGFAYCNSLVPWQPGDTLRALHAEMTEKDSGLVVALDEVDEALVAIKAGSILPHKNIPISVASKPAWNRLFDDIDRGLYPNLIVLMTSNRPMSFIDELDPSFMRGARVPLKFVLDAAPTA